MLSLYLIVTGIIALGSLVAFAHLGSKSRSFKRGVADITAAHEFAAQTYEFHKKNDRHARALGGAIRILRHRQYRFKN